MSTTGSKRCQVLEMQNSVFTVLLGGLFVPFIKKYFALTELKPINIDNIDLLSIPIVKN